MEDFVTTMKGQGNVSDSSASPEDAEASECVGGKSSCSRGVRGCSWTGWTGVISSMSLLIQTGTSFMRLRTPRHVRSISTKLLKGVS